MVSKTFGISQQTTVVPERQETNEGSPTVAPAWESVQSMAHSRAGNLSVGVQGAHDS